jgi:integrase
MGVTVDVLREHKTRQAKRRKRGVVHVQPEYGNLVFTTRDGAPLLPRNLRRRFMELTTKAKLPRIRLHDLRHTHASQLLAATKDVQTVSARLGHATPGFTLTVYGHMVDGQQRRAVDRLEETMFGHDEKRDVERMEKRTQERA